MRQEIRLSGSGGQGVILIGVILAEAGVRQGFNAIQSQSYGPEARGGSSKAEVIISSEEINFTKVTKMDVFLSLTQNSFSAYKKDIQPTTTVLVDSGIDYGDIKCEKLYSLPILHTSNEELKKPIVANIVALGAMTKVLDSLDKNVVLETILSRVPKGTEELNIKAFEAGYNLI